MKRSLTSINAGSVADIAFLLLIFFLVSTTIAAEEGLRADLPPPIELDGPTHPRNVLEIKMNTQGALLVEGEPANLEKLREVIRAFYESSGVLSESATTSELPKRKWITPQSCDARLQTLRLSTTANADDLKKWEIRKATVNKIGNYRELPSSAGIILDADGGASYADYIQLQEAIKGEIIELRSAYCKQVFDKDYRDLNKENSDDILALNAAMLAYPNVVLDNFDALPAP